MQPSKRSKEHTLSLPAVSPDPESPRWIAQDTLLLEGVSASVGQASPSSRTFRTSFDVEEQPFSVFSLDFVE